jgi:hypothetical protein
MYSDKNISDGKLVIDVTYFFFHVQSETHNFCDGTSCPATGEFVLASEQMLPSFTPPVSIDAVQCVVLSTNYTCFSRIETVSCTSERFMAFCSFAGFLHYHHEPAGRHERGADLHLVWVQHRVRYTSCYQLNVKRVETETSRT